MRIERRNKVSAAAVVAMLALVLGGSPAARAAAETPQGGAQTEGIKVHGQWTIDVLNPDGSLASHHEFRNALESFGGLRLAEMLARLKSPGVWNIGLRQGGPARKPCPSYFNGACVIGEVGSTDPEAQFKTMTVSVPGERPQPGKARPQRHRHRRGRRRHLHGLHEPRLLRGQRRARQLRRLP